MIGRKWVLGAFRKALKNDNGKVLLIYYIL